MKSRKSFKSYPLRPFITGTSNCVLDLPVPEEAPVQSGVPQHSPGVVFSTQPAGKLYVGHLNCTNNNISFFQMINLVFNVTYHYEYLYMTVMYS